ncbi:MAG TPA: hypothetical protein VFQ95_00450 [Rhodanobacteraceae bacterium]|nr:hypothetical protein [Rhodanobacteraceae bacterium]
MNSLLGKVPQALLVMQMLALLLPWYATISVFSLLLVAPIDYVADGVYWPLKMLISALVPLVVIALSSPCNGELPAIRVGVPLVFIGQVIAMACPANNPAAARPARPRSFIGFMGTSPGGILPGFDRVMA